MWNAPEQPIPPVEIVEDEPENPPAPKDPPVEDPPEPPDDAAAPPEVIEPEDIEAAQAVAELAKRKIRNKKGPKANLARKHLDRIKELLDELEKDIGEDGIAVEDLDWRQREALRFGNSSFARRALAKLDEWLT